MRFTKGFALFVIIAAILAVAIFYFSQPRRLRETTGKPLKQEKKQQSFPLGVPSQEPQERQEAGRHEEEMPSFEERKIAIIIDDIGYDLASLKALLQIDAPITFAVLPRLPHSVD